jgi:predicted ester cyclase
VSRDLVNRMVEEIQNKKRIELCDELFSADFVNHTPPPGIPADRAGMRELFARLHAAFPDGRVTVLDQAAESDRVWTRKAFKGTHTGTFAGVAPTGKTVTYEVIDILAVRDGKLAEHWAVVDRLDLSLQLGLVRRPG